MMCFRYKKLLIPYSEGVLDQRSRERVERHLAKCQRCAAELRAVRAVSSALRQSDTPAAEPAPDLWAKVSARIADEPAPRRLVWIPQAASAVAAAVLVAVIGLSVMQPKQAPQIPLEPQAVRVSVKSLPRPPVNVCESKTISKVTTPATKKMMAARMPRVRKPVMVASLPETHDAYTETNSRWYEESETSALKADSPSSTAPKSVDSTLHFDSINAPTHNQPPGDAVMSPKESRAKALSITSGTLSYGIACPPATSVPCDSDSDVSLNSGSAMKFKVTYHDDFAMATKPEESIVETLNDTEGVRMVALFTYP